MEIRLLGPVEMVVEGVRVDLGPPRQRAVLAAIAAEVGEPVQVETVIDRVWGIEPPDRVRQTLYVYVARIRRILDRTSEIDPLTRRSRGYVLAVDPDRVDLHRFRSLVDQAREPNRPDEARAGLLREALDLWHGPPLAGLPDGEWVIQVREGYRQRRLDAAMCWAEVEMGRGQSEKTIGTLIDLVAEYPHAESLVDVLMRALDASGRPADALDWFHRTRIRLAEDLGTDPGPDLSRVYQTMLRRTSASSVTSPAGSTQRPAPHVAPAEGPNTPAQLPAPATGFAGRREYLGRLDALVPAPTGAAATVVITGMAGVGKTALAVRWGRAVRERFPGGQLFADLHGYADRVPARPIEVLAAFLTALGVPAGRVPATVDESAALYRSLLADRPPVLVVLDNTSHPDQVRPLRPAGDGCLMLVTSRDRLSGLVARDGAYRLDLGLLARDEARAVLSGILSGQGVPVDNTALDSLAIRCGYLPLALRIAAANVLERGAAAIDGYLAELAGGDRLTGLQVDGDDDAAVRVAFDLSYAALPAATRGLFRLLGYVPGADVTTLAAAALAGAPITDTATRLRQLTAAHLVSEPAPGRYALHDLLRLYAAERGAAEVSAEQRAAVQVRLLNWYRDMANAADRMLRPAERPNFPAADGPPPFADAAEALAWLDVEAVNLAAAVENYAIAQPAHAWRIAAAMYGWLQRRHRRTQWVALYEVAAGAAARAAEPAGEAMVVSRLAIAYGQLGDTERAMDRCGRAYQIRLATGDHLGAATALLNLAAVHLNAGRPEEAIARLAEAEALSAQLPDTTFLTTLIHSNLGEAHHLAGRLEQALTHYHQAMVMAENAGSTRDLAHILLGLGRLLRDMGDLPGALARSQHGIDLAREAGDEILTAEAHELLGHIHAADAQDPAARRIALRHLRAALAVYEAKGHRHTDQLRRLLAVDWRT
jgi:DNA-binding SARP family transcriptional activator/tetratricopeptide (TPR) repeat protein